MAHGVDGGVDDGMDVNRVSVDGGVVHGDGMLVLLGRVVEVVNHDGEEVNGTEMSLNWMKVKCDVDVVVGIVERVVEGGLDGVPKGVSDEVNPMKMSYH